MNCKIQWVDAQGQPTPDNNPAVGVATCRVYNRDGSVDERSFPICAEHLAKLPWGGVSYVDGRKVSEWSFAAC